MDVSDTICTVLPWRSAGGVDCPLARLEDLFSVRADAGRRREGSLPPLNVNCEIGCVERMAATFMESLTQPLLDPISPKMLCQ